MRLIALRFVPARIGHRGNRAIDHGAASVCGLQLPAVAMDMELHGKQGPQGRYSNNEASRPPGAVTDDNRQFWMSGIIYGPASDDASEPDAAGI